MKELDPPSGQRPLEVRAALQVPSPNHEFHLTIISDARLASRLIGEVRSLMIESRRIWSEFKVDPSGVAGRELANLGKLLKKLLGTRNVMAARLTAFLFVCSLIVGVLILERHARSIRQPDEELIDLSQVQFLPIEEVHPEDSGVGAGREGRVGFNTGKGEGSKPQPARAQGGGGSGKHELMPPQVGKIPQPSAIPAPIPAIAQRNPALPAAGIDIDPALYRDLPFRNFGDPRSKSTIPSSGPGDGGAIGAGSGLGFGEGDGSGFGPGHKRNIGGGDPNDGGLGIGGGKGGNTSGDNPDRVLTPSQVESRARVISKPEPQYTEGARQKQVTGTVVLRVIFARSGEVTNIQAVSKLPEGLTKKAIAAARAIRFTPATKGGHPVSVYMQLEYNFNLY